MSEAVKRARKRRDKAEVDARWWHERAGRGSDSVAFDRARELYPEMFDLAGNLLAANEIDFRHIKRARIPVAMSEVYQSSGVGPSYGRAA